MTELDIDAALRGALDDAPVGVGLIAEDLRVVYGNARLATVLGTEVARLVGSDLSDWVAEEVREQATQRLHGRFAGRPLELGARFRSQGLDVYFYSVLTQVGGSRACFFIAADAADSGGWADEEQVLGRLAAAVSTKVGEDFFTSLVLALTSTLGVDYAMVAEVDSGGAHAQTIAAAAGQTIMPPFHYALGGTPCADVLTDGPCWHVQGVQRSFPSDHLLTEMSAEAYAGVPLLDVGGRPIGLLAILHRSRLPLYAHLDSALQIAAVRAAAELQRRRRERDLARANRYLDDLIETASVMIVELDLEGRLLRANRCFEETTGYSRAELQAEGWMDRLQPPERYPEIAADVRRYLREGWPAEVEAPLLNRQGEERIVVWRNSALRDHDGHVVGTLAVGADITERLRAEAERERLRESLRRSETLSAVGSLVAGVAHEVRNPLFGITATLDAFEAELGAPPATREYLDVLRTDVLRLRRLMDDLLTYGRPHPPSRQVQPLPLLVAEALRSVRGRAAARTVELRSELAEPLPQLPLDGDRMLQVLKNLVENGVELCAAGGSVVVTARYQGGDSPAVVCTVRDQGPGFRADDLRHLFEPFYSRRPGGSGLGLAIVHKIVSEHGGTVSARNAAEGGAEVEVRLPVNLEGHAPRQSPAG